MPELSVLKIEKNQIMDFSPLMNKTTLIDLSIDLASTKSKEKITAIDTLKNLQVLKLTGNGEYDISLSHLNALKALVVDEYWQTDKFKISDCPFLHHLSVSGDLYKVLFNSTQKLHKLDVSSQMLTDSFYQELQHVKILELRDCRVYQTKAISRTTLEDLVIEDSTLESDLPSLLAASPSLKTIKIVNSNLDNVVIFKKFRQLSELDIQKNSVESISELNDLSQFKVLTITDNPVTDSAALNKKVVVFN